MDENGSNAPISSPTSSVSPAPSEHHSPAGQLGKQGQRNLSYIQGWYIGVSIQKKYQVGFVGIQLVMRSSSFEIP